ncbi:SEC22B, partial [Symbiodinium microadriaticum]
MISDGICYLTLTDKSYPKRLAFLFLEEIAKDFVSDLQEEYGDEWLRTVETVGRQYAFIKF